MNGGTKEIPVQVNGKMKFCITVDADLDAEKTLAIIKDAPKLKEILEKNEIIKEVYVPNKIYNIVVKNK